MDSIGSGSGSKKTLLTPWFLELCPNPPPLPIGPHTWRLSDTTQVEGSISSSATGWMWKNQGAQRRRERETPNLVGCRVFIFSDSSKDTSLTFIWLMSFLFLHNGRKIAEDIRKSETQEYVPRAWNEIPALESDASCRLFPSDPVAQHLSIWRADLQGWEGLPCRRGPNFTAPAKVQWSAGKAECQKTENETELQEVALFTGKVSLWVWKSLVQYHLETCKNEYSKDAAGCN